MNLLAELHIQTRPLGRFPDWVGKLAVFLGRMMPLFGFHDWTWLWPDLCIIPGWVGSLAVLPDQVVLLAGLHAETGLQAGL